MKRNERIKTKCNTLGKCLWIMTGIMLMLCFLTGCSMQPGTDAVFGGKNARTEKTQYQATFLDLFNTVTTVVGKAENEEVFTQQAQAVYDSLLYYHQLFDVYNDYEGVNNIKTINDQAGIAPVKVDAAIVEMLADCKEYYEQTNGRVNAAMGSVLYLWHTARNDSINDPVHAYLPETEKLKAAAEHTDMEKLVIDREASTVFLSDPDMRLDVGAIAKGWATQKAADEFAAKYPAEDGGFLISVGGNVCATGPKDANGTAWVIGIQKPDGDANEYLHTVYVKSGCVVTSGDYQRTYAVDGKQYHHIIDPDTLFPSAYWRSVTIICEDSGQADALSTALFLMDLESGQKLLKQYDAAAMWVNADGEIFYSPGFKDLIRT